MYIHPLNTFLTMYRYMPTKKTEMEFGVVVLVNNLIQFRLAHCLKKVIGSRARTTLLPGGSLSITTIHHVRSH
jgi:hypothetical protein